MPKKIIAAAILFALSIGLGGCGETYGSLTYTTSISVAPVNGIVYMIPKTMWDKYGGRDMLNDPVKMELYYQGPSPLTVEPKRDLEYVYVAKQGGRFTPYIRKTANPTNQKLNLQFMDP